MPVSTDTFKGIFEGTTEIDLVPEPAAGSIIVTMIRAINVDSVAITPKFRILNSRRLGEEDEYLNISSDYELATSEYLEHDGLVCVLAPGQKLVGSLAAAHTTTKPQWMVVIAREVY
jgi:hypothetical protein